MPTLKESLRASHHFDQHDFGLSGHWLVRFPRHDAKLTSPTVRFVSAKSPTRFRRFDLGSVTTSFPSVSVLMIGQIAFSSPMPPS